MTTPITAALTAAAATLVGLVCLPILAAAPQPTTTVAGIDRRALAAYHATDRWCTGLRWQLVAAIGWVESGHGTHGGARVDPTTGVASPPILGPPLDGSRYQAIPAGPWQDRWGATGSWMRALGAMQFLPPTFAAWAVDADRDGTADPHDLDDAAATAANYLCQSRTGTITDERRAVYRYNHSTAYVDKVLAYADQLTRHPAGVLSIVGKGWLCPVAGPTSFVDSWHAPRSGGRLHQGVDMFAASGTPAIAPVAGTVEHFNSALGGLSYRLWGDDGNYYFGTHLDAYATTSGHVAAGTILGYIGDTGNARGTGPHLHFEIHPGRRPGTPPNATNPTPTVSKHCAAHRKGRR